MCYAVPFLLVLQARCGDPPDVWMQLQHDLNAPAGTVPSTALYQALHERNSARAAMRAIAEAIVPLSGELAAVLPPELEVMQQ